MNTIDTVYTKTDKYALNLYGDNDPADLREGYNDSMHTIDDALETHRGRIEGVESRVPDNVNALSCNDSGLFFA